MSKIRIAMVLAKPGHLRKGLQSLLRTIPQIEILAESNNPSILLKMKGITPELILVDGSLIDEKNWSVFKKIKTDWPGTKVIVLTENDQQSQSIRKSGADFCLQKGFRAPELAKIIETSLIQNLEEESSSSQENSGKA